MRYGDRRRIGKQLVQLPTLPEDAVLRLDMDRIEAGGVQDVQADRADGQAGPQAQHLQQAGALSRDVLGEGVAQILPVGQNRIIRELPGSLVIGNQRIAVNGGSVVEDDLGGDAASEDDLWRCYPAMAGFYFQD